MLELTSLFDNTCQPQSTDFVYGTSMQNAYEHGAPHCITAVLSRVNMKPEVMARAPDRKSVV